MSRNRSFDPGRRSIRLAGWDYTRPAVYFVTICTAGRVCRFDVPAVYEIVASAWRTIPEKAHAAHVCLDEWVVMPNHLHGLVILTNSPEEGIPFPMAGRTPLPAVPAERRLRPGSLGAIIGNFKSLVTRRVNNVEQTFGGKVWQRGYYERIVRNERELKAIRRYIRENPDRWAEDRGNLEQLCRRMRLARDSDDDGL